MATTAKQHDGLAGVRLRLKEWGEWLHSGAGHMLGLPHQASYLAEHIGGFAQSYVPHAAAEEIDRILLALKHKHPSMYGAIEQEYYWQAATKLAADRLGISPAAFKNWKLAGEYWVDGKLSGVESNYR